MKLDWNYSFLRVPARRGKAETQKAPSVIFPSFSFTTLSAVLAISGSWVVTRTYALEIPNS